MFRRLISLLFLCGIVTVAAHADSLSEGNVLFGQGTSFYQKGSFSAAYKSFNQSIFIFEEIGRDAEEELIGSYLWAGATAFNLGHYGEAENLYIKSLKLAESRNLVQYQSNIVSALANLKFSLMDYSVAGDWYLKSSDLLKKLEYHVEARSAYEYGGYAKTLAGKYSEANEIFQNSIGNSPDDRAQSEMAWLYAMRGNSNYYLQNLDSALDDYQLSISILEQYDRTPELIHYYGWAGKIYFDSADNESALEYFIKALNLAKKIGGDEDKSRVLAYLGFLYGSTGEYEKAVEYYEGSLEKAKSLGRVDFLVAAYESLDWIHQEIGNEPRLIEIKQQLIPLYQQTGDELKQAQACNDLGFLFYNRRDFTESIPIFEKSVSLFRNSGLEDDLAISLLNLGMSYEKSGKPEQARIYLNESLSLYLKEGRTGDAEDLMGHFNLVYSKEYDYLSLISVLEKFIPLYEAENSLKKLMHLTNNIGAYYYRINEYERAIEYYREALDLAVQMEDYREQSICLHNIAQSNVQLARFDESFRLYNEALQIARENGVDEARAHIWNSMGELYRAWGWFEKSLSYYKKAEIIFEETGDSSRLADVYNNIGQTLRLGGDPEGSVFFYQKALSINSEIGEKSSEAVYFNNLGEAHRDLGNNDEALSFYTKALQIDIEIKNLRGIQIRKNNIAIIDMLNGNYEKAIETYIEGLKYWKKIGNPKDEASVLVNLWKVYFNMDKYETAADYLVQAVRIQEELRLTAEGPVRREYLEYQVETYRDLAATYYYMEDPVNSLYFLELSRGKYLLEEMNLTNENAAYEWSTHLDFINNLDERAMLLSITIADRNLFQAVAVHKGKITTTLINIDEEFLDDVFSQFRSLIRRYIENPDENRFESILRLYRLLLARPIQSRSTEKAVELIGKYLYSKLILPFNKELEPMKQLIIVPDGILGTIPFEVLQDEGGNYLVEKYDISYSQSLVISQMIREREYTQDRIPLLAFGGAIYEEEAFKESIPEKDVNVIRQNVSEMIQTGGSTRGAYSDMGLGSWKNLPGTLDEVNLLSEIVPGAEIITGADVTEETIMDKSDSGALAGYKVIHFATHGIVIPEIPELSAVVLSQFSEGQGSEDGYLTMGEIARLDIKADFVNLSACETGLGKIYQGEGVVGLTQAFLIAGANALSVSLWQVSDESTKKFMTGMYSLVEEEGLSYAQAISEMKRIFLKDDLYKNPFFWAPFIHYGDYEAGL